VGHGIAALTGQPLDGFSLPYQYSIALGAVFYTIIGLVFSSEDPAQVFQRSPDDQPADHRRVGDQLPPLHDGEEPGDGQFSFSAGLSVLVWCTLRWHEDHRRGACARHRCRCGFHGAHQAQRG
jgi:hypothetical protein